MSAANDESSAKGATSSAGLERWQFRYTIDNFGPERLESGKKHCENDGCICAANMIVEGSSAIYFACSRCAQLIPSANVLRSNAKPTGRPEAGPSGAEGSAAKPGEQDAN